jgi:hypothetical protein
LTGKEDRTSWLAATDNDRCREQNDNHLVPKNHSGKFFAGSPLSGTFQKVPSSHVHFGDGPAAGIDGL